MTYSLLELMRLGGVMMWPLLLCSALAMAIIVERFLVLGRTRTRTTQFLDEVIAAVKRRKIAEALALCEHSKDPVAQMVRAGLQHHGQPREAIRQAVHDAGQRAVPQLERNLVALGTLAQVAPLFGLLGTALGLIRCFAVIQTKAAALQPVGPVDLAQGIWQALLTTTVGLAIAIPAIVAYNYFTRRVQRVVWDLEIATAELLDLLSGDQPA